MSQSPQTLMLKWHVLKTVFLVRYKMFLASMGSFYLHNNFSTDDFDFANCIYSTVYG